MNVAIQGELGSFHAAVAEQYYENNVEIVPCASFAEVFNQLETGAVDDVVCAVENTIYGSINEVYQLIDASNVPVVGEVKLPVSQQLIGLPAAKLSELKAIYSHPVALAQCRKTLETLAPQAQLVEYYDTAAAVQFVRSLGDPSKAAIASKAAAELYDLPILQTDVNDSEHNITRFLILSRQKSLQQNDTNRASLVVTTSHKPGALAEILQIFAKDSINLVKIQSQPIVGQPWNYKFFIVADCTEDELADATNAIKKSGHAVRVLGRYCAAS